MMFVATQITSAPALSSGSGIGGVGGGPGGLRPPGPPPTPPFAKCHPGAEEARLA